MILGRLYDALDAALAVRSGVACGLLALLAASAFGGDAPKSAAPAQPAPQNAAAPQVTVVPLKPGVTYVQVPGAAGAPRVAIHGGNGAPAAPAAQAPAPPQTPLPPVQPSAAQPSANVTVVRVTPTGTMIEKQGNPTVVRVSTQGGVVLAPAEDPTSPARFQPPAAAAPIPGASKAAATEKKKPRAPIRDEDHSFSIDAKSWKDKQTERVVMQERDYSCGAAALATLLKYHWGDEVTETQVLVEVVKLLTADELRERVQNGLSLTDLRRAAVKMNYQATIGKLEFDKLKETKIPLVVGIVINNFDHFVVYRGSDDTYVYLADPARGNVRVPAQEFVRQWQKNLVLVVVKEGGDPDRESPLKVSDEEKSLGTLNRQFVRDQTTSSTMTLPR